MTGRDFTPRLTSILSLAEREADLRGRRESPAYQDVLFALLWEGRSLPAGVLDELDVANALRERVATLLDEPTYVTDPVSGDAERRIPPLMLQAINEAQALGHNDYLGVEHAFLAMTSVDGGVAQLLAELDARESSREGVLRRLSRTE